MIGEGRFEARKIAYRQTRDGVTIMFLIHPNDVPNDLALAPLGTIYAIGYREMPEGDTSNSGHDTSTLEGPPSVAPCSTPEGPKASGEGHDKPRRRFHKLSRREQACIACGNRQFQDWIHALDENDAADLVRNKCGISSRRHLDTHPGAAQAWDRLYAQYLKDTGMVAEDRT